MTRRNWKCLNQDMLEHSRQCFNTTWSLSKIHCYESYFWTLRDRRYGQTRSRVYIILLETFYSKPFSSLSPLCNLKVSKELSNLPPRFTISSFICSNLSPRFSEDQHLLHLLDHLIKILSLILNYNITTDISHRLNWLFHVDNGHLC